MIDRYIDASKNMTPSGGGTNKKCYSFDDVVLLVGAFVNGADEESILKNKLDSLQTNGVNVCRILEKACVDGKEYELQEKAKGEELFQFRCWYTPEGQRRFLETLNSLSNQDISFYKKFLDDWSKILQMGFAIDPSKSTNFFYDGKEISFIDLNLTGNYEREREWMLIHAAVVLRGGGALWFCKDVMDEAKEKVKIIYQKLGKVGLELGEDMDKYISYLDPNDECDLKEYFEAHKNGPSMR